MAPCTAQARPLAAAANAHAAMRDIDRFAPSNQSAHGKLDGIVEKLPLARVTGLEPATSGVTGRRSNQLSYTRKRQGARSTAQPNPRQAASLREQTGSPWPNVKARPKPQTTPTRK